MISDAGIVILQRKTIQGERMLLLGSLHQAETCNSLIFSEFEGDITQTVNLGDRVCAHLAGGHDVVHISKWRGEHLDLVEVVLDGVVGVHRDGEGSVWVGGGGRRARNAEVAGLAVFHVAAGSPSA